MIYFDAALYTLLVAAIGAGLFIASAYLFARFGVPWLIKWLEK